VFPGGDPEQIVMMLQDAAPDERIGSEKYRIQPRVLGDRMP
jgi:hypothetical protein